VIAVLHSAFSSGVFLTRSLDGHPRTSTSTFMRLRWPEH